MPAPNPLEAILVVVAFGLFFWWFTRPRRAGPRAGRSNAGRPALPPAPDFGRFPVACPACDERFNRASFEALRQDRRRCPHRPVRHCPMDRAYVRGRG